MVIVRKEALHPTLPVLAANIAAAEIIFHTPKLPSGLPGCWNTNSIHTFHALSAVLEYRVFA
jgi:hypothetical protein